MIKKSLLQLVLGRSPSDFPRHIPLSVFGLFTRANVLDVLTELKYIDNYDSESGKTRHQVIVVLREG